MTVPQDELFLLEKELKNEFPQRKIEFLNSYGEEEVYNQIINSEEKNNVMEVVDD
jgi:hypothetical protein